MVYPEDFAMRIGFAPIRSQIAGMAFSAVARERILSSEPVLDRGAIALTLDRLSELKDLLLLRGGVPDEGYHDLRAEVLVLRSDEEHLGESQLTVVREALLTLDQAREAFTSFLPEGHLASMVSSFALPVQALGIVQAVLTPDGQIRDDASPELHRVRRALASRDGKMTALLNRIVSQGQQEGFLPPETKVVIRDGIPVIPIPAHAKSRLGAVVRGYSRGGQTLYVEPYQALELQGEIRALREEEQAELTRILREVTSRLRLEVEELEAAGHLLSQIDELHAKAKFACQAGGAKPILSNEPKLYLRGAQHPSLLLKLKSQGGEPVALDLELNAENRILVISGPNAGGKSVCLKTVGTAIYMLQSGFLPFVKENSEMCVFEDLLLDIGDAQSMESDLSTYSSHLQSMRRLLEHSSPHSLCLIDELGSGTEPLAGGAIAQALLRALAQRGTMGIVTTHYSNLKQLAATEAGLANGAMQYDIKAMKPLFKLRIGAPGSSFAFEIAQRMGLPPDLLEEAQRIAGEDYISLDQQLHQATQDRRFWEEKRVEIQQLSSEIEHLRNQLAQTTEQAMAQRREILSKARHEAQEILATSNRTIERTIREIREAGAERERTRTARAQVETLRQELNRAQSQEEGQAPSPETKPQAQPLEEGQHVRLIGSESVGQIVKLNAKRAVVAMGNVMTSVEVSRLEALSPKSFRREQRRAHSTTVRYDDGIQARKLHFQATLDIRGLRGDEALSQVQNQLDDALMVNEKTCRVLHGKGNGILRQLIRQFLRENPHVEAFADEDERYGGAGITVYTLR